MQQLTVVQCGSSLLSWVIQSAYSNVERMTLDREVDNLAPLLTRLVRPMQSTSGSHMRLADWRIQKVTLDRD